MPMVKGIIQPAPMNENPSLESQEFIGLLKKHHPESFDFLIDSFGGKIFNLALRMTGNEEDASDITQETFLLVYRHINDFRGESRLYTWIFAIAKNLCFHLIKKPESFSYQPLEKLILEGAKEGFPKEITELEKQRLAFQVKEGCLTGLVRCLSFNQRIAFVLHVLIHLPINEVSAIMGKSEGAIKVLIHRARMNLKKFLCRNCSLYHPANHCHCKNMIEFSLKKGWISLDQIPHQYEVINPQVIEDEVHNFHEIIQFYYELNPQALPQIVHEKVRLLMQNRDWLIFSDIEV